MPYAHITGWGMSVPQKVLTNDDLSLIEDFLLRRDQLTHRDKLAIQILNTLHTRLGLPLPSTSRIEAEDTLVAIMQALQKQIEEKSERDELQRSQFKNQQKYIKEQEKLIDRFRALPMARSAVVGGRAIADLLRHAQLVVPLHELARHRR